MITAIDANTALILIDLQNSVVKPVEEKTGELFINVNALADAFRNKNLPVIVVNVDPKGAVWTTTRKDAKQPLPPDDASLQITNKLKVVDSDIRITKHTWNAFFETSLHKELQQKSVTGIVLAGISTSIGVEGTARAAAELGYNISFATDAMTDTQQKAHEKSIEFIFPRLGETGTTAEIMKQLINLF